MTVAPACDLLISGGTVVDGTGGPPRRADVAVHEGRIVAVRERLDPAHAAQTWDATGLLVSPGFIDAHGHSDLAVLSCGRVPSKIAQGITTEVMGNCGLAVAPVGAGAGVADIRGQLAIVDVDPGVPWTWRSMADYLDTVRRSGSAMNVAMLAGHLAIRASCVGFDDRPPSPAELAAMCELTDTALREGACGLSTGLMYPPCSYAAIDELIALGEVVASHDKLFTFHMRDYGDALVPAVAEALCVADRTGARVQISHLAVVGRRNWGAVDEALRLVDAAVERGLDVAVDCYPYLAGSTNLTQLLPRWALEGGTSGLLTRLADHATRARIVDEVERNRLNEWSDIVIAGGDFATRTDVLGRSVADIAATAGDDGGATLVELAATSAGRATIVAFGRSEDDLHTVLSHRRTMIGSDGLGLDSAGPSGKGQPHPRSFGCYPRLLGHYVRERGWLDLTTAVHKASAQVAKRFGIPDRGVLAPGYVADLVAFDPATIIDRATYEEPQQSPDGVRAVFVSGVPVLVHGVQNDALPGQVLRIAPPAG